MRLVSGSTRDSSPTDYCSFINRGIVYSMLVRDERMLDRDEGLPLSNCIGRQGSSCGFCHVIASPSRGKMEERAIRGIIRDALRSRDATQSALALTLHLLSIFEFSSGNTRTYAHTRAETSISRIAATHVRGHIHLHINVSYFEMKCFLCLKTLNDDKSNKVHYAAARDFCMLLTHRGMRQVTRLPQSF